jgi:ribosomal protein L11 methyltransferase
VQEAIRALVAEGELIYSCEYGRNWIESSYDRPVWVSGRTVLSPPEKAPKLRPGDVVVQISAGAAFGVGRHPTTRLALRGIEAALRSGFITRSDTRGRRCRPLEMLTTDRGCSAFESACALPAGVIQGFETTSSHLGGQIPETETAVLDIGTGSGVLVIAAVKLGIQTGLGLDLDPCALWEAKANVHLNGLDDRIVISDCPAEDVQETFTLIAANLRPPTLLRLAPTIAGLAGPNGALVLSGIRAGEHHEVLSAFHGLNFEREWIEKEEEWAGLMLKKKG